MLGQSSEQLMLWVVLSMFPWRFFKLICHFKYPIAVFIGRSYTFFPFSQLTSICCCLFLTLLLRYRHFIWSWFYLFVFFCLTEGVDSGEISFCCKYNYLKPPESLCSTDPVCCHFVFFSDPYVKLSLYVADENRELSLVQTKTIKKVGGNLECGFCLFFLWFFCSA